MEKNNRFYIRGIICLLFILCISMNGVKVSAQEDDLTWITSKAEAVETALSEGKYILLLAGRPTCGNCNYMRHTVCELDDPAIKTTILENYVPWFCHVDESTEYYTYATGLGGFTLPLICRIDPRNPDEYIDRSTSIQYPETFYNRLLNGLGDIDDDGMPDEWERDYGLDALTDDAADDPDEDGLINLGEYNSGTNPNDSDSDDDGMPDGWEVQNGLSPLVNDAGSDADSDGWTNLEEYLKKTIPNDASSHPSRGMPWLPLLLDGD